MVKLWKMSVLDKMDEDELQDFYCTSKLISKGWQDLVNCYDKGKYSYLHLCT